jgi:hypothetical protein
VWIGVDRVWFGVLGGNNLPCGTGTGNDGHKVWIKAPLRKPGRNAVHSAVDSCETGGYVALTHHPAIPTWPMVFLRIGQV